MKKIKLLSLFLFSFMICVCLIISCSDNQTNNKNSVNNDVARVVTESELIQKVKGGVEIACDGGCDCYFNFNLDSGVGKCSCSPCQLELHFLDKKGTMTGTDKDDVYESILENLLFKSTIRDVNQYVANKYATNIKGFTGIEFYIENDVTVIVYKFIGEDNKLNSVLYSQKTAGPKYRVDCTGGCGCLEQYNFNTNTASCSCSDCNMVVTQL